MNAIGTISGAVGEPSTLTLSMAGAIEEQATATKEMSGNISAVSASANETSRLAAAVRTISEGLAQHPAGLGASMERFLEAG